MSRERHRRGRGKGPVAATAEAIGRRMRGEPACADCTALAAPRAVAPGVVVLVVAHDPGCPSLAAMARGGHS